MLEIDITHTCPELETEFKRLYDIGFDSEINVEVSTTNHWEVTVIIRDRLGEEQKIINIGFIDVNFCPYCGTKLPSIEKGDGS